MATQFANILDMGRWVRSLVDGGVAVSQDAIPAISSLQTSVLSSYAVDSLPAAATAGIGRVVYCSDGASGSAILAFCNSVDWLRSDDGTAVADGA